MSIAAPRQMVANGLPLPELSFRFGILLGSLLFLHESMGFPWSRNLYGMAGLLLSVVIVLTMAFQWRVFGDWRRWGNQVLYFVFLFALTLPLSATLHPTFGQSLIPDSIEKPLVEIGNLFFATPVMDSVLGFVRGVLAFLMMGLILLVLVVTNESSRRTGLGIAAVFIGGACLFIYSTPETFLGLILLGLFVYYQWEIPVMIPDRLYAHLNETQLSYLKELVREKALSTGETRVYLDNNPKLFADLVDFQLVEYDSIAREVIPGRRLREDRMEGAVGLFYQIMRRGAWILVGIVYFLLPDFVPGPIDDIIIMSICTFSGFNLLSLLGGKGKRVGRKITP